jgi:hypothetical protein
MTGITAEVTHTVSGSLMSLIEFKGTVHKRPDLVQNSVTPSSNLGRINPPREPSGALHRIQNKKYASSLQQLGFKL